MLKAQQRARARKTVTIAGPDHPDLFSEQPTPTEIHVDALELLAELVDPFRDTIAGVPARLHYSRD